MRMLTNGAKSGFVVTVLISDASRLAPIYVLETALIAALRVLRVKPTTGPGHVPVAFAFVYSPFSSCSYADATPCVG